MAKVRSVFVCQSCGAKYPRWSGRCQECGEWNTLVEEQEKPPAKTMGMALHIGSGGRPVRLDDVQESQDSRFSTGLSELDRVLGGGLVEGSLVLLGGPPGIGKSTLLLQMAGCLGKERSPVLYVSGEESPRQIRLRAKRLGVIKPGKDTGVIILPETNLEAIEDKLAELKPGLVIVDSIQTVYRADLSPAPGSVTQVRECAASLMRQAKTYGFTTILVGHVTKGGEIAGPRVLEHLVDTVLHFDGHGLHNVRALRTIKNRFGSTQEMGLFEMEAEGLRAIPDASTFFMQQRVTGTSGNVVFPSMEGTRPVLVELQALVSESYAAQQGVPPTRRAVGLDVNRLSLLLAVLSKRCSSLSVGKCDVYISVAGGIRLQEPALDLPLALAIASSRTNVEIPADTAACGEVGLGGEIRAVSGLESRLAEIAKLGFKRCLVPARSVNYKGLRSLEQSLPAGSVLKIEPVESLPEALRLLGLSGRGR